MTPADLRRWRADQSLSLQGLATLLGVQRNTVWRWEAGIRAIPAFLPLALEALETQLWAKEESGAV